jgi:hypothetical protein
VENREVEAAMKSILVGVLSAAMVAVLVSTASAGDGRKKQRQHYDSYSQRYPSATPRQLQNLRAYERGDYYEQYSEAHPVGSRSWWELKEREGNRFRF